jgi:hypothetical protein
MKRIILFAFILAVISGRSFAVTFNPEKVPYDSSFHIGVLSGPGAGIDLGGDMFFPVSDYIPSWPTVLSAGAELELLMTNSDYEQNVSMQRYGFAFKYKYSDDLFFTAHLGSTSFYLTKLATFIDSFSGDEFTLDEDTHGSASYLAFAVSVKVWDYFFAPKCLFNRLQDGGTIFEVDLNISHPL